MADTMGQADQSAVASAGDAKASTKQVLVRSDSATATLAAMAEKLVLLRVTTVVGTAAVTFNPLEDGRDTTALELHPNDQLVASSTMNMLLGDFTQVFSKEFLSTPEYSALHTSALVQAHDTRDRTVAMLKEIATYLAGKL